LLRLKAGHQMKRFACTSPEAEEKEEDKGRVRDGEPIA
jgi:hypothetical protein